MKNGVSYKVLTGYKVYEKDGTFASEIIKYEATGSEVEMIFTAATTTLIAGVSLITSVLAF